MLETGADEKLCPSLDVAERQVYPRLGWLMTYLTCSASSWLVDKAEDGKFFDFGPGAMEQTSLFARLPLREGILQQTGDHWY